MRAAPRDRTTARLAFLWKVIEDRAAVRAHGRRYLHEHAPALDTVWEYSNPEIPTLQVVDTPCRPRG